MERERHRVRSEVFLREDIRCALNAIDRANASLAMHLPQAEVAVFRAGFVAAIQAMAASFDVSLDPPPIPYTEVQVSAAPQVRAPGRGCPSHGLADH